MLDLNAQNFAVIDLNQYELVPSGCVLITCIGLEHLTYP